LTEIRLEDKYGQSAGNIDVILARYDDRGRLIDFGALEVQAVYISGNVRRPFEQYMTSPETQGAMEWPTRDWPRPDYLSSSRKRLAPQLLYKGGILHSWGKKQAVALSRTFFDSLPVMPEVDADQADIAWIVYDMAYDERANRYLLRHHRSVYTQFQSALARITVAEEGDLAAFSARLQTRLDDILDEGHPPDAPTISDLLNT
jgi:hypothetical protein